MKWTGDSGLCTGFCGFVQLLALLLCSLHAVTTQCVWVIISHSSLKDLVLSNHNPLSWTLKLLYPLKSLKVSSLFSGWCGHCLLCNDPSLVPAQLYHQPQTISSESSHQLLGKVLSHYIVYGICGQYMQRCLLRLWWWRLAVWFEENVRGPVPPGTI